MKLVARNQVMTELDQLLEKSFQVERSISIKLDEIKYDFNEEINKEFKQLMEQSHVIEKRMSMNHEDQATKLRVLKKEYALQFN